MRPDNRKSSPKSMDYSSAGICFCCYKIDFVNLRPKPILLHCIFSIAKSCKQFPFLLTVLVVISIKWGWEGMASIVFGQASLLIRVDDSNFPIYRYIAAVNLPS